MGERTDIEGIRQDLDWMERESCRLARRLGDRTERVKGAAMSVWNRTRDWERRAKDGVKSAYSTAYKQGARKLNDGRRGIGHYPISSVAGALLVGVILGVLVGHMCNRED